jgi:hypothetical protein
MATHCHIHARETNGTNYSLFFHFYSIVNVGNTDVKSVISITKRALIGTTCTGGPLACRLVQTRRAGEQE